MASDGSKRLFLLGYADEGAAEAAARALKDLQAESFLELRDSAIVTKAVGGKVSVVENKDADPGAQRGALAGATGAALVALLSTPIGIGAVAVGAGIGAVTAALGDSGFQRDDLAEVGHFMEDGRSLLLVAVRPEDVDRLRDAMTTVPELVAADRRLEAEVKADSKDVLRDALAAYKDDPARADD
jgi:uncharacterized membrane protein